MQHVRNYRHITVTPIVGVIGAEITGVNLAGLDDLTFEEIRRAFADHVCIFFPDQDLTATDLEAFGGRFGNLVGSGFAQPLPVRVTCRCSPGRPIIAGASATTETSGTPTSRSGSARARSPASTPSRPPSHGGDTMFASMYAAFDALSPRLQTLCEQLDVIHSAGGLYGPDGTGTFGFKPMRREMFDALTAEQRTAVLTAEMRHPLVAGAPGQWAQAAVHRRSVRDPLRRDDARREQTADPLPVPARAASGVHHALARGPRQLGIWDNLAAMHVGVQDYAGMRREMYRIEVEGTPVIGASGSPTYAADISRDRRRAGHRPRG